MRLILKQVDIHSEGGRVKMSLVDIYRERVTLKLIDIYREREDNNETSKYIERKGG